MFWICPNSEAARCSFFEWDDEPPRAEPAHDRPPVASGSGSSKPGTCFKVSGFDFAAAVLIYNLFSVQRRGTLGER